VKTVDELMELDYRISLHKDEDGDYIAKVEELPGCVADGRTPNKAVENLREAMKSWMLSRAEAGLHIPEPRDSSEYSGKLLVRMPRSLHEKLSVQAASEGVSLNQYIVSTLSENWGKTSIAGTQGLAVWDAVFTSMKAGANSRTALGAMALNACVVSPSNQTLLTQGTIGLLGASTTFSSQAASIGTLPFQEDELQKRPRRIEAA
jgi:antitoxin HicB